MITFQVQLWPDGKWDGNDYRLVDAESPKEAAEKLLGATLSEGGSNFKIRARVRRLGDIKTQGWIFYEP